MEAVLEKPKSQKKNKAKSSENPKPSFRRQNHDEGVTDQGSASTKEQNLNEIKNKKTTSDSEPVINELKLEISEICSDSSEFKNVIVVKSNIESEHLVIHADDNRPEDNEITMPNLIKTRQNINENMEIVPDETTQSNRTLESELETTNVLHLEKLLNFNKEILSTIKFEDVRSIETAPQRSDDTVKEWINPYTEQQLSALYHNAELDTLESFNSQYVEAELKGLAVKQHPLYELLLNYLKVREKITGNSLEIEQTRKEYKSLQSELWTIELATATVRAECQDGQIVSASHCYNKSIFHRTIFQSIVRGLGNIQKLVHEHHTLYTFSAEDLRLQIELYLQSTISSSMAVTQLTKDAKVALTLQSEPIHLSPYLSELRLCISVLFSFQRRLIRDNQFLKETRNWLKQLVAVLLRVANYQDHLFLLNHILRCPPGVGAWAAPFVQLPFDQFNTESPFANYQINHVLTILANILTPVNAREVFLKDIAQNDDVAAEALWVVVDSEGEEDDESSGTALKENDLVALLNQLPLDDIFRSVLLIDRKDCKDHYDITRVNEHHILRFFAFSTTLLKILHTGLKTYCLTRYNQFSKRLSRFIRHVVQYATDQWEQFLGIQKLEDCSMMQRLQIEYDAFFLRAIYYLYTSQKSGAWQFLAVVPYNLVDLKTLWKIFYFLHSSDAQAKDILNPLENVDYSTQLWSVEFRVQFEEKLDKLEEAEVYYLLNTFANMALARGNVDSDFIYHATMDLLQVSFISETTQENCSKCGRNLLTHITSKHPYLLSNILKSVKENIEKIGELALYLYEDLPLSIWKLTDSDLHLISRLLINHKISTTESKLARMILSRLNWDLLPYEMHSEVAILVLTAVDEEPGYLQWGWQTILRLKLHISDRHFTEIGRVQDVERNTIIMKGIREQKPLASFVALLMTDWGHLVPLIGSKGLPQIVFLQNQYKHEAVLFLLYQIIPLFISSQETLINCEKFQEIITNILKADRGYISIAKSYLTTTVTVVEQFGNMIETQIVNFANYDLDSPRCLVRLWVNALVSVPQWNRENDILYLLDCIVRTAFFYKDALEVVYEILRDLHQSAASIESSGSFSTILKWVSHSHNSNNGLIQNSLARYSWLSYFLIEIEFQERERNTGLWNEVLKQLAKQTGKINVDHAVKKAASTLKVTSFPSSYLCIYRWAQQAMDTNFHHPLLPLLWQKFFTLYLARVPVSCSVDRPCVGEKFFDGLVNFQFLKKIKRRLQDSVQYFQMRFDDICKDETVDPARKFFYETLCKIFQAFLLWLEEPRLQENILFQNLPPQYEPQLLMCLTSGNITPWYEYLDYDSIKLEQQNCIRKWRVANYREKTNVNKPLPNAGKSVESIDPVERILRRLTSYDTPKPAPDIVFTAPVIPQINFNNKESMFLSLDQSFKTLKQYAHNHTLRLSEHKALDCSYQELIPQLYRSVLNKIKKKVPCKGKNQTVHCSGAAIVVLEMQEARINERIEHQIQTNRNAYESLLTKSLESPSMNLCSASVTIQQAIKLLQSQLRCNPATAELGVELFYYILSLLNEETQLYLPTKTLFATCLERIGQSHICGVEIEMPGLLKKILHEPSLGGYLAPHFSPLNVATPTMLLMYATISKEIGQKYDITFALLSKFEIDNWLNNKGPKLSQRSQFIQTVIKALVTMGFDPPIEALMLHGLYRKHLLSVFEYQFPEHYGEILIQLLKASNGNPESNLLSKTVWLDILNSLSQPATLNFKNSLREQVRQYAQYQKMLQHQELLETAELLSKHFTQERLQYGLYGLYPKCRNYMDVFVMLLGMTGHGIIVSMLNTHQGLLGDKMCDRIWPFLRDMFAPWLVPYSMQTLKENMASWIQQLADDRSVLLPFIPADTGYAQKVIGVFFECISFVMHTLPASTAILSHLWQWYVTCFAHTAVKDHILIPLHQTFVLLPWQNFWPSVIDLEYMLRVVDLYLPECHSFLGHLFISIPWSNWLNNFDNTPPPIKSRVYQCFLNLIVKLTNEPNVRKNYVEKTKSLLLQAESFDWQVLEPVVYQHVVDWFVMSYDPGVILKKDPLDLDYRVLHFLKTVAGYNKALTEPTQHSLTKRLIFVKTNVKILSVYTSRHKSSLPSKHNELINLISHHLDVLEANVKTNVEMEILLKEFCCVLNICEINQIVVKSFNKWIESKPGNGLIVKSMLKTLGIVVTDFEIMPDLLELALLSYFTNVATDCDNFEPKWEKVTDLVNIVVSKQTELEYVLLNKNCILTLNAVLLKRIATTMDREMLLNLCLDWMTKIKICDTNESKVPLLWLNVISLALDHMEICDRQDITGAILYKFAQILLQVSEDKGGGGWGRGLLNAIGVSTQGVVSLNFRFVCRALAGYILAQLPDMKGEPQTIRKEPNAPNKVGQPGGNTDCPKVLLALDFGQSQGKIKECAKFALKQIQDPKNSLHNAKHFLLLLLQQFYTKPYLKDIG